MKQHLNTTVLAGTALLLSAGAGLFAGEPAPYIAPPAPPSDCSGCIDPGFYVEGSLLYMNSYASEDINDYDGEWDLGYRGTIGFENATGLFAQVTGFYYSGDYDATRPVKGEVDFYAIDILIGDNLHCSELCVDIAGGLRFGGYEDDRSRSGTRVSDYDFDGVGPVIEIAAERALTEQFGLYAELRQSILFGEGEYKGANNQNVTNDTLASITEIGAGLQVNFAAGPIQNAHVRLGFEGQYWLVDSSDHGLFGAVLSIGGNF